MLTIVDRYVLRQVAKPLATAMAIGLLVLLAERMVRLLDTTLGKKNSFAVVFELLAYLVPHYLGLPFRRHFSSACFLASTSCRRTARSTPSWPRERACTA